MPPSDDDTLDVRDLKTLLARQSATSLLRITRVVPGRFAAVATSPHFSSLASSTTDTGVSTDLVPIHSDPRAGGSDPWQWLYDRAARTSAPRVAMENMAIMLEVPTLLKLLDFIETKCLGLEHLTVQWPFHSTTTDATLRYRALEAVDTALFAPSSRIRLQTLDLDLGELSNLTAHMGVDPHGNKWMSRMAALTDSRRGVSRTIRQCVALNARRGQSSGKEVVGHAFVAALSTNAMLRRAEFVGELSAAVHAKLRAIPPFAGRPLVICHRLAFLGANEASDSQLVLLPRGVVATVLEFAGRRTRR